MTSIRIGIGGWTYEPWRGVFFPDKLPQKRELEYAASRLTAIEVNGTFYGRQKPATFAAWAKQVPDGFTFALKASRYCTNRKSLAEAGESIERFFDQGLVELGDRLGPILWQFAGTKKFVADDFAAFLALLPKQKDGLPLRHALEVRHDSFRDSAFAEMARGAGVAIVLGESDTYPRIDEDTADFRYARFMQSREEVETGYDAPALDGLAATVKGWAAEKDVYGFFISGAKVRAPAAAMELIARVK